MRVVPRRGNGGSPQPGGVIPGYGQREPLLRRDDALRRGRRWLSAAGQGERGVCGEGWEEPRQARGEPGRLPHRRRRQGWRFQGGKEGEGSRRRGGLREGGQGQARWGGPPDRELCLVR